MGCVRSLDSTSGHLVRTRPVPAALSIPSHGRLFGDPVARNVGPRSQERDSTSMKTKQGPAHVVVDGSNLATEGRSMPSLKQLSDAVMSFMEEYPNSEITVVVDATFGHRIDKKESREFEEGIANNELVAPPAGAVGRGDAFVLSIANKAGSTILSNDSFQEFHGDYEWLFDEGRLIGGKPVPHVGWVWVARTPVRGPISRKATRGQANAGSARGRGGRGQGRGREDDDGTVRIGSPDASAPMPVPKGPPPTAKRVPAVQASEQVSSDAASQRAVRSGDPVNELLPFLEFVEHHPVGTSVNGTVDTYSSHGAYITIGGEVRGYIPLRMMADPMPRSAKSIMKVGESVTAVVVSFNGARRSIDCALPDMANAAIAEAAQHYADDALDDQPAESEPKPGVSKKAAGRRTARATAVPVAAKQAPAKQTVEQQTVEQQTVEKKAAGTVNRILPPATPVKQAAPPKTAAKKVANKQATTGAKKAATKGAKKAATKQAPPAKQTVAKKVPAQQTATKQTVARQTVAKQTAAKTVAKQTVAKQTAAKQTVAKQTAAKKTVAKKTAAKKTAAKKTAAKKTAVKKSVATKEA